MQEIREEMEGETGEFFFLRSEFLLPLVERVASTKENAKQEAEKK